MPRGKFEVKWLRTALKNLECEAEYISQKNPSAAVSVVSKIRENVRALEQFPALGRPGRVTGTRELVIPDTPYIIPYRVVGKRIEILRVFHSARKCPASF